MYQKTVINPSTGRENCVLCWKVNPREVLAQSKAGKIKTAKDLSWMLLSDDESIQVVDEEQHGDSSHNNFALSTFENALDWSLGLAILNIMRATPKGKILKPFEVAANRKGEVFIILSNGRVMVA
jgi:DNA helicase HerA-like ATPase